jgi:putative flavoprotein involved in K+ transport
MLDVVIIGAGQAGLALGYYLKQQQRPFVILDGAASVGASWASRWDSLTLFTPAEYDALPGMPFPAPAGTYPTKDEVAAYLQQYATVNELLVRLNQRVTRLTRRDGHYQLETLKDVFVAHQVVVATGPFQRPFIPALSQTLSEDVLQLHSARYRNSAQLPAGRILVVGAGNSGAQIAEELSATHDVTLSIGKQLPALPQRVLGRSLFWWLKRLRIMDVPVHSRLGRRLSQRDILIGTDPARLARSGHVRLVGRAEDAEGNTLVFAGGERGTFDVVLWATGYQRDYGWIDAPVFDETSRPVHERGVTRSPGLYFLGLSWQHTRGSALLGWVARDAAYLAQRIEAYRGNKPQEIGGEPDW